MLNLEDSESEVEDEEPQFVICPRCLGTSYYRPFSCQIVQPRMIEMAGCGCSKTHGRKGMRKRELKEDKDWDYWNPLQRQKENTELVELKSAVDSLEKEAREMLKNIIALDIGSEWV